MKYSALNADAGLALQYDTLALAAISRVYDRFLPWTNAALRPAAIQIALNDIVVNDRRRVVELGAGLSTMYLSALLAQRGGRLLSVDHDAGWLDLVRSWMTPEQASATELLHAPLGSTRFEGHTVEWYDHGVMDAAIASGPRIDLLIVDGPPAYFFEGCVNRGPALAALRAALAPGATILLDDINRTGEQQIADHWSAELGVAARHLAVEAGVALWLLGPANNISQ